MSARTLFPQLQDGPRSQEELTYIASMLMNPPSLQPGTPQPILPLESTTSRLIFSFGPDTSLVQKIYVGPFVTFIHIPPFTQSDANQIAHAVQGANEVGVVVQRKLGQQPLLLSLQNDVLVEATAQYVEVHLDEIHRPRVRRVDRGVYASGKVGTYSTRLIVDVRVNFRNFPSSFIHTFPTVTHRN